MVQMGIDQPSIVTANGQRIVVSGVPAAGQLPTADGPNAAHWAAPAGGGLPVVRKFPFAFNTPDILTGAVLYVPTVGDILLNAWVEIDEAWDGTTPMADVGTFVGGNTGLFFFSPILLIWPDTELVNGGVLTNLDAGPALAKEAIVSAHAGARVAPAKFTAADPIKVCVSQDGTNVGAAPGSTAGAAVLYLVTATPV
jgi:hypothetical protein